MIFLKRIETVGFKSFANHTVVNFESSLIGIVGPNGSGKSNINDAVRWAFGEQSNKSLRSDSSADIVFAGSKNQSPLNYAEVTLVFDNSNKVFSSLEYEEVSIKRVYKKDTNESSYYINNQRVRLKDVLEVALETGITKSSLAIISQGSVSNFVESKPEERRVFFDEAAGVAKYKKRKEEAIRNLVRSKENYDRLNDIVNEKEKRIPSLKRQAEKALVYKNNYDKLKNMELSRVIKQVDLFNTNIKSYNEEISNKEKSLEQIVEDIFVKKEKITLIDTNIKKYDTEVASISKKVNAMINQSADYHVKINTLNLRKEQNINSNDSEKVKTSIVNDYKEANISAATYKKELSNFDEKLSALGQSNEKLIEVKSLIESEIKRLDKDITEATTEINIMNANAEKKSHLFLGVKTIMQNKENLPGIIGMAGELISFKDEYKEAIDELMKNSYQNVVVSKTSDAKTSIDFLKANNSGHATFLPLDNLKANYITGDARFIIQSSHGFIGFANELVNIEKKYKMVADNLLSNGIVFKDFNSAIELSKINNKFHIVTLNGEHILPYGAIVGGSKKRRNEETNISKQIKVLEDKRVVATTEKEKLLVKHNEVISKLKEVEIRLQSLNSSRAETQAHLKSAELNAKNYANSFFALVGKDINDFLENSGTSNDDNELINLNAKLKKLVSDKSTLEEEVSMLVGLRNSENENLTKIRNELSDLNEQKQIEDSTIQNLRSQISNLKLSIANDIQFLSRNYQMTLESAKEYINANPISEDYDEEFLIEMRTELNKIGSVDLDSISIYEEEKQEYEKILGELDDINEAIKNIEKAIANLDDEMVSQFKKTFNDINRVLPEVFANFFGSGKAQLVFTNPDDVINSGIEILIEPPGKRITNLNLLSGGEKSLVALATLFSILKVRPIPLVMLDEVEAPLDIVNVERFAKYLKTFNEHTQFIVVTHRQGTMENCDSLFGATMQEPGVTNIVKINLVEARKLSSEE